MNFRPTTVCLVLPKFLSSSDFPCLHKWRALAGSNQICCSTVYYNTATVINSKSWTRASSIQIFAIPMHTYYSFGLSVDCDDLCPSLQGSLLLITPHKHYPFSWITSHTRLAQLVLVPFLRSDCFAEEVVKTHTGKPPHSAVINTCLLFIYPHRAHSLLRIWDHQSVSYWLDKSSFWQCYWYQLILICF